jgi:hypothetical protein
MDICRVKGPGLFGGAHVGLATTKLAYIPVFEGVTDEGSKNTDYAIKALNGCKLPALGV